MQDNLTQLSSSDFIESTDAKKDIDRFITALYGQSLEHGHLILWTKPDRTSAAFQDINKASGYALDAKNDRDVYFGVGLQKEDPGPLNRGTKEGVVTIPGFWMDIDIQGPGHTKQVLPVDQSAAMEVLDGFGFKPTMVVSSGGGLHVYWLFHEPWQLGNDDDRKQAAELSKSFQRNFIEHGKRHGGYEFDYTGDLSRVLRLPGTLNHKAYPVPVEVIQQDDSCRYSPGDFQLQLEIIPEGRRNNTLTSIGGTLRAQGAEIEAILNTLSQVNRDRCSPPLPDDEVNQIANSISGYDPGNGNQPTKQAERIVALAGNMDLFHTGDGDAYAQFNVNSHKEVWPLKSMAVRHHLDRLYRKENGGAIPGSQGRQDALGVLTGKALYDFPERNVHVRVAEADGCIYLDLCNDKWEVVQISSTGWEVTTDAPVLFRRAKGMGALPKPEPGGNIEDLFEFINADDSSRCLITAFLLAALRPDRPFPILILQGEQGSAKSTTARMVRELVDPSASALRTLPRSDRDLMVSANNGWILAYDNLSGIQTYMSDALCRISTGGGLSTRSLYTDGEEKIFDSMRPVILNGIDDIANRGDLADRSLIINLPRIPKEKRKLEQVLWEEFNAAKPKILGALLDAVSLALRNLEHVKLDSLPRMADFAQWIVAAEPALPWEPNLFMKVHSKNQNEASHNVLDSDPVAKVLQDFIEFKGHWQGTASDLLRELELHSDDEQVRRSKSWPRSASYLSGRVRRLAPTLRELGFKVDQTIIRGNKQWRFEMPPE